MDVLAELRSSNRPHGCASSPLVTDGLVIVGGGELVAASAWNLSDGQLRWTAPGGPDSYCSPQACELLNQPQVIAYTATAAMGLAPQTGETLWQFPWSNDMQTNCAQPVQVSAHSLCLSSGYGKGAVLIDLQRDGDQWRVSPRWTSTRLQAKFCSPVLAGNMLVGLDNGFLTALDVEDGRRLWKEGHTGMARLCEWARSGSCCSFRVKAVRCILSRSTAKEAPSWRASRPGAAGPGTTPVQPAPTSCCATTNKPPVTCSANLQGRAFPSDDRLGLRCATRLCGSPCPPRSIPSGSFGAPFKTGTRKELSGKQVGLCLESSGRPSWIDWPQFEKLQIPESAFQRPVGSNHDGLLSLFQVRFTQQAALVVAPAAGAGDRAGH